MLEPSFGKESMTSHNLYGLGVDQFIDGKVIERRAQRLEQECRKRSAKHVWVFMIQHRLSEAQAAKSQAGELGHLDVETITMAAGPICYRCESPYTTDPCPGWRDSTGALQ